jgi:hypothetical protein
LVSNISQAGPPLVELPTPLNQRVLQLTFAIEGASTAPTAFEMAQMEILLKRIPEAAGEVRKLVSEDLAALNQLMLDAKIPYVSLPAFGGGGRRPQGAGAGTTPAATATPAASPTPVRTPTPMEDEPK